MGKTSPVFGHGRCARTRLRQEMEQISFFFPPEHKLQEHWERMSRTNSLSLLQTKLTTTKKKKKKEQPNAMCAQLSAKNKHCHTNQNFKKLKKKIKGIQKSKNLLPWPKKENHPGDASCDIEESAAWFHCDASMREVAAVTSRVRSRFRSWIKLHDSSISQDSD